MNPFYYIATITMKTLLVILARWQVTGKENVPRTGPLIVVANHLSLIDPPLLGASIPRRIIFMAKQELFNPLFSRTVVSSYGAFPVKRGQLDRQAMRQALRYLQKGHVLGMFPEGKRSPDKRIQSPQFGASLLASHSNSSLLPVGISGSEQVKGIKSLLHRPTIRVNIGEPFQLPLSSEISNREKLARNSDLIMQHISELLPESYR